MAYDETTPFELIAIIGAMFGAELAHQMAIHIAGRKVYVPASGGGSRNVFRRVLGQERARQLGKELGGVMFEVPRSMFIQARNARVREMYLAGHTAGEIASEVQLTERHVFSLIAAAGDPKPTALRAARDAERRRVEKLAANEEAQS